MANTNPNEWRALAEVAGPQRTRAELETLERIADMKRVDAQIAALTPEERMERSAAVLAGIVTPEDAEAVRAAFWLRVRPAARMVALMAAGLDKSRHKDGLRTFDAFERGRIWVELEKLQADIETMKKCMNGGEIRTKPMRGHVVDGIAAIGQVH